MQVTDISAVLSIAIVVLVVLAVGMKLSIPVCKVNTRVIIMIGTREAEIKIRATVSIIPIHVQSNVFKQYATIIIIIMVYIGGKDCTCQMD